MSVTHYSSDTVLALLLEVSQCTFARVVHLKKSRSLRYEFGQLNEALLPLSEHNSDFVPEPEHHVQGFTFSCRIINSNHAHIDCVASTKSSSKVHNDARKSIQTDTNESSRFTFELIHNEALPEIIQVLCSQGAEPSKSLLQTLVVTAENLQLMDHYLKFTRDSLTKLQSRSSLQQEIDDQILHSSIALCMVHCIDFQQVNRKFGQAQGDKVLHEIAAIINQLTRAEDISGRFGGALFGIAVKASSAEDGHKLAVKLQTALHNKPYLQNAIRLSFNVGVAFVSQQEAELDTNSTSGILINRAEQALRAAQTQNKPSIVQWEPGKFRLDEQEFNYLGGIFTPDNVTNYRNMLLLWDISSIIADEHSFPRLLKSVIERLAYTFEFSYSGVISDADNKQHEYSYKLNENTELSQIDWEECENKDVLKNAAKLAIQNSQHTEHQEGENTALVIPLGTETKECFFIMGENTLLDLTHDSVMLFVGFARQIGKALKRSQLEDELNRKLEKQNAQLEQELLELKAGLKSSALVYRSDKMQKIVEQTQRAAQTDATVLVTGESGTGKEKLIHAIHSLSPRSNQPLIIVDCGSIPETLIESELFGHTKGAFTGAQSGSKGKIQAAQGGIIVLDEIGELPLAMQPKLLRFVQEKQFTPVGSNQSIKVDVKIVAVTNRDLAFEVSQGKFRKDLFYRLNVVSLHNPPLRERSEDIELLCTHFLGKFARQFEMDKKVLSPQTIQKMKSYPWPGNIRELENKLMQASLLTTGDEINYKDLNLDFDAPSKQGRTSDTEHQDLSNDFSHHSSLSNNANGNAQTTHQYDGHAYNGSGEANSLSAHGNTHSNINGVEASHFGTSYEEVKHHDSEQIISPTPVGNTGQNLNTWEAELSRQIDSLLLNLPRHLALNSAVGNAIEGHLLRLALNKCRSTSKTAILLQLPVSTARRRLMKPVSEQSEFDAIDAWQNILQLLNDIVESKVHLSEPVERIKHITASRILAIHGKNMTLASQLMGVSEPTMYKYRKYLQQHPEFNSLH